MGVLIAACSSSAHRCLDLLPTRLGTASSVPAGRLEPVWSRTAPAACSSTYRRNALVSSGPGRRKARGNTRRRSARSKQPGSGCRDAPRPGSRPRGSGTHRPSTTTIRSRSLLAARTRQPTQVRCGHTRPFARPDTGQSNPISGSTSNGNPSPTRSPAVAVAVGNTPLGPDISASRQRGHHRRRPGGTGTAPAWHRDRDGHAGPQPAAGSSPAAPAAAGAGAVSGRMSIRQPVSLAARRAFWPSLPIASESW
jgi:hypothetical protein